MNKSLLFKTILIFFVFFMFLFSCQSTDKVEVGQFNNIKKISLSDGEKEYLLISARKMLEGKQVLAEKDKHPSLFEESDRGIFITAARTNENALCSFGYGKNLFFALENAADNLMRLIKDENLAKVRIRVDIVSETTGAKTYKVGDKFKTKPRDVKGVIFYTDPPVALLPDEIIMRNIIDHKDRFYYKRLKNVFNDRIMGKSILGHFKEGKEISYSLFKRISFMESKDGKSLLPLLNGRRTNFSVDAKSLLDASIAAGEYLKKNIRENGRFNYKYYPHMERVSDSYNLLRHAGTAYAMTELYEITGDDRLLDKIKLAHKYLLARMSGPSAASKAKGAVFKALVEPNGKEAKAGGAGLCIIALAKYTTVTGDKQHIPIMQALAKFILHQTEDNGHLIAKYYFNPTGKEKPFESIYYPGECVLALTRLYQIDGNKTWIKTAEKLVDYMVYIRDKSLSIDKLPHDHWLSIGMADLYPITKNPDHKKHVYNIGQSIFNKMRKKGSRADWTGSFYTPPRSTPSATRNEGTIALYFLAKSQDDPTGAFYKTALKIAGFHRRMQIDSISGMFLKHPEKAIGGFTRSFVNPEIQIDYVQHNISAMLGLWKIQIEKQGRSIEPLLLGKLKHTKTGGDSKEAKPAA